VHSGTCAARRRSPATRADTKRAARTEHALGVLHHDAEAPIRFGGLVDIIEGHFQLPLPMAA